MNLCKNKCRPCLSLTGKSFLARFEGDTCFGTPFTYVYVASVSFNILAVFFYLRRSRRS